MKNILLEKLKITKSSAMPIWLKRNPNVLSWLIEQTKDYSEIKSTQRLYILMHGEPPKCSDGNYRKFNTFDLGYRTCCHLGNKCKSVTEDRLSKHRNTMMNLYGVENSFQLESGLKLCCDPMTVQSHERNSHENHFENLIHRVKLCTVFLQLRV